MVYYVVFRASEKLKDWGRIRRRLQALGCTQVRRSFWEVGEEKENTVLRILQKNEPILLRRTREVRKPRYLKGKGIGELGSLVVIAYKVPEEVKREKIKNFLKKAPCIRLCRSVYAFSQNHSRFDKNGELVDARRFWKFIQEIDEDVKVIPRMAVVNSESVERLLKETEKRVEREIDNIVGGYKRLIQRASRGEMNDQHICNAVQKLKRRLATVRKVAAFYEKWLNIDLSKSLIKPYPYMRKVRSTVNEKPFIGSP